MLNHSLKIVVPINEANPIMKLFNAHSDRLHIAITESSNAQNMLLFGTK